MASGGPDRPFALLNGVRRQPAVAGGGGLGQVHYPAAEATGSAQTAAPAADDGTVAAVDPAAGTTAAPTVEDAAEITADSAADTADSAATAEADTDPTEFDTRR